MLLKHTSVQMFDYFAQGGYLSLIKEARSRGYRWNEESVCREAAFSGHLDILKHCHESGCQFPKDILSAPYSSLECLKYLHELGMEWTEECSVNAASSTTATGSLERLKYCHENGCKCTCCIDSRMEL
jgi:hypothetical protein